MRKILAILALLGVPVLALALDGAALASGDPTGVVAAILDAAQHGHGSLTVVVLLIAAIRAVRALAAAAQKSSLGPTSAVVKAASFVQGDVGGTALTGVFAGLLMLVGPLSAGQHFTPELAKSAGLVALSVSGGWNYLRKFVHPIFGQIPVIGGILEWATGKAVDRQLPPVPATDPAAQPTAMRQEPPSLQALQEQPKPADPPPFLRNP